LSEQENRRKTDLLKQHRVFPRAFAIFYLYWMSEVLKWAMAHENPKDIEWLVASVVAGAAAYFKFYVDTSK
jgi:hypothetical protein